MESNGSVLQIWMLSVYPPHPEEEEQSNVSELHRLIGTELAEEPQCAWLEWNGSLLLLVRAEPNNGWGRVDSALRKMESTHACRITRQRPTGRKRQAHIALATAVEASSYEWSPQSERHIRYEDIEGRTGIRTVCSMEEETKMSSLRVRENPPTCRHG